MQAKVLVQGVDRGGPTGLTTNGLARRFQFLFANRKAPRRTASGGAREVLVVFGLAGSVTAIDVGAAVAAILVIEILDKGFHVARGWSARRSSFLGCGCIVLFLLLFQKTVHVGIDRGSSSDDSGGGCAGSSGRRSFVVVQMIGSGSCSGRGCGCGCRRRRRSTRFGGQTFVVSRHGRRDGLGILRDRGGNGRQGIGIISFESSSCGGLGILLLNGGQGRRRRIARSRCCCRNRAASDAAAAPRAWVRLVPLPPEAAQQPAAAVSAPTTSSKSSIYTDLVQYILYVPIEQQPASELLVVVDQLITTILLHAG